MAINDVSAWRAAAAPPMTMARPPVAAADATRVTVAADRVALTPLARSTGPAALKASPFRPVTGLDAAIGRMQAIEAALSAKGDMRAVFVTTYLEILHATQEAVATPGYFEDPATVELEARHFAQLYLDAFEAYERGDRDRVPGPWLVAFDLAAQGKSLAVESLLLGINAHVNYDLPRALVAAGAHAPANERDFARFNDLLFSRIDTIKDRVVRRYTQPSPLLGVRPLKLLDRLVGPVDNVVTQEVFVQWRDRAWAHRQALHEGARDATRRISEAAMGEASRIRTAGAMVPFRNYLLLWKLS